MSNSLNKPPHSAIHRRCLRPPPTLVPAAPASLSYLSWGSSSVCAHSPRRSGYRSRHLRSRPPSSASRIRAAALRAPSLWRLPPTRPQRRCCSRWLYRPRRKVMRPLRPCECSSGHGRTLTSSPWRCVSLDLCLFVSLSSQVRQMSDLVICTLVSVG